MKQKNKIKIECWNCGKIFYVNPSQRFRKFCPNSNCYNEYKNKPEYKKYLREKMMIGNKLYKTP